MSRISLTSTHCISLNSTRCVEFKVWVRENMAEIFLNLHARCVEFKGLGRGFKVWVGENMAGIFLNLHALRGV